MIDRLPNFCFEDYSQLLVSLQEAGYRILPVTQMIKLETEVVYLRHDVDAFLSGWRKFPEKEAELGISATYYVPLTQYYNPLQPDNQKRLRYLIELGHEIGLHYDLSIYPEDPEEAQNRLDFEVKTLEFLTGTEIKTISTHCPYKGIPDPFKNSEKFIHPHNKKYEKDLMYVSDSVRSWRDENLLRCFSQKPPKRLLLLTHIEGFLDGAIEDRVEYLEKVMFEELIRPMRSYFFDEIGDLYRTSPVAKAHDARETKRKGIN